MIFNEDPHIRVKKRKLNLLKGMVFFGSNIVQKSRMCLTCLFLVGM